MKKIYVFLAIFVIFLVGCQAKDNGWPDNCRPQERFCESKGMSYECGDWKFDIMFCTDRDCTDNKVSFTQEEFYKFEYGNKLTERC